MAEAGSVGAQFMPALHVPVRIGEGAFTDRAGSVLRTVIIPIVMGIGGEDIPGATDTGYLGIQGGDGTVVSAGMTTAIRIQSKTIRTTFMPILTTPP